MHLLKKLQQQVRNLFAISSMEANAFIVLFSLMLLFLFLTPFIHLFIPSSEYDFEFDKRQLGEYIAELEKSDKSVHDNSQDNNEYLSPIDPNSSDFESLIAIGLDTILAARVIKYRNAGGVFNSKDDLLKIYGLDEKLFTVIKPKLDLPEKKVPDVVLATDKNAGNNPPVLEKDTNAHIGKKIISFDINKADTATLKKIYGVGPVLSHRIIKYRKMLGGFVNSSQLSEVYGLDTEVVKKLQEHGFIDQNFKPKKISINNSSIQELRTHPYIDHNIAKTIVSYRRQHGDFSDVHELKNIKIIEEAIFEKILPYLSL